MIKTNKLPGGTQKEVGFIHAKYNNSMVNIDHIMTKVNGQMKLLFEQGFTRVQEATILPLTTQYNALNQRILKTEIDGNSKQETTTGKNLFDISYAVETQYNNDGTENTNQNNKYTLSDGIITAHHTNAGDGPKLLNKMLLPAGTYTISATYNSTDYGSELGYVMDKIKNMDNQTDIVSEYRYLSASQLPVRGSRTFTLTEATNVCFGFTPKNAATGIVTLAEIQLEEGSATSYEPYTGGQPSPSPDYPQEIEVIEVYNLFDESSFSSITNGGITTTKNSDGSLTSIGTTTGTYYNMTSQIYFNKPLPAGTYTFSIDKPLTHDVKLRLYLGAGASTTKSINAGSTSITITMERESDRWMIYSESGFSIGQNINETIKVNFVKGAQPQPYLPYNNMGLKVTGKNLFDKNMVTIPGYINENGENGGSAGVYHTSDFISISPNTSYVYSGATNIGTNPARCYYDINKNFISGIKHNNQNPFINTSPSNAYYMKESIDIANINNLQLEKGSTTATPYEPYKETIFPIPLNNNWIGKLPNGVKDEVHIDKYGNVGLLKKVGKVVLDGSEGYWNVGTNRYGLKYFYRTMSDKINGGSVISNNFTQVSSLWNYETNTDCIITETNNKVIGIMLSDSTINTTELFKTWLSTHNTEVYYELATPYTVQLGNIGEIDTYKGINNIEVIANLEPSKLKITYKSS